MLKYSIKFDLNSRVIETPQHIRLRVSFNSQRSDMYTGIMASVTEWDFKNAKFKTKDKRQRELSKIIAIIDEIFTDFEVNKKRYPAKSELVELFKQKTGRADKAISKPEVILLQDVIKQFILYNTKVKQWKDGTIKSYTAIMHHFQLCLPNKGIEDFGEKDIETVIEYFQTGPLCFKTLKKKAPHRNTTIKKNIADFMAVLKWAAKKNIYKGNVHETFEHTFKGTTGDLKEIIFLEWEELIEMYYKDFGSDRLNHVRDVFAFCCFSGQRFSDVKKLKHSDIRDDYFVVVTEKTIDPLRVDLNDYSREILSRYKDLPQPLPIISHDKTNEYLKEIGEIMMWNEPITEVYFVGEKRFSQTHLKKDVISTHAGRRTFIVNAIKMNIPTIVVRTWTGHKDERSMRPYVKIVNEHKAAEMSKFNKPPQIPPQKK